MRAAAIERHRAVWRIFEGERPEAWSAHMRIVRWFTDIKGDYMDLFAYTEISGYVNYPAYVSINRDVDGTVRISVRSREPKGGGNGTYASIDLSEAEWDRLKAELRQQDGWMPATFVTDKIDYAAKCKRRRTYGPTPCLCCPGGECVG